MFCQFFKLFLQANIPENNEWIRVSFNIVNATVANFLFRFESRIIDTCIVGTILSHQLVDRRIGSIRDNQIRGKRSKIK